MKKSALIIMTLLFLLVGFTNANVIASTSQAFNIPSYAVISYPETFSGWEKTITWSDSTTENIRVDSYGNIYLNDSLGKSFGFCFFGWLSMSTSAIETALDWMDEKGVRFVDIYFYGNKWTSEQKDQISYYFPKFYAHKKFVRLILATHSTEIFDSTEIANWKTGFDELVDHIDSNNWEDMVYSIEVTHEAALTAYNLGKTVQQLSDTLDEYYNHAYTKLSTSDIGNVPILHAAVIWANPSDPSRRDLWKKLLEKTDIIWLDMYPETVGGIAAATNEVKSLASQVGKTGYKHWHEFGHHTVSGGAPTYVSVEYLTTLLDESSTGDVFLFYVYEGYDPTPEVPTWYFASNGNAEYWTELLAPYFPH